MKSRTVRRWALAFVACNLVLSSALAAWAAQGFASATSINKKIDESVRIKLFGNVRPEATKENDRGAVSANMILLWLGLFKIDEVASETVFSGARPSRYGLTFIPSLKCRLDFRRPTGRRNDTVFSQWTACSWPALS
jgi:hypothetical protein